MEIECKFFECFYSSFYSCNVVSASITNQFTDVKAFKGQHCSGNTTKDVKMLKFEDTHVDYLPRGLYKTFGNLVDLYIINCGLKEISRKGLIGLENLQMLHVGYNELTSVPSDLFVNTQKLKWVVFLNNKIERLSSRLFSPLMNQLELVDLRGNVKIDAFFLDKKAGDSKSISFDELMEKIDSSCDRPIANQSEMFMEKIVEGFEELWNSKRLSDFAIIVDSKEFLVHKVVLATRSSVFSALFENEMHERQSNQMKIQDFSADAVEEFLQFFYSGRVPNETNAMELYALASKYDVLELKENCEANVLENLDESNAVEVLNLGHLYSSKEIVQKAFDMIIKAYPDIDFPDNLKNSPVTVKKIIDERMQLDVKMKELQEEHKRKILKLYHKESKNIKLN